jgi:hypothetical protein
MINKIKASGILIYSYNNNNKLVFLLGKENKLLNYPDSNKYCDFGGHREKNETIIETAIREFDEESMGSIMDINTIKKKLLDPSTFYVIINNYVQYVVKIEYNETIPLVYNRIRNKLENCMKYSINNYYRIPTCPTGYLEKSEMKWFTLNDIKNEIKSIRKVFIPTIIKVLHILLKKNYSESLS